MLRELMPYIASVCADVGKEAIVTMISRRRTDQIIEAKARLVNPESTGCPYCQITRHLSAAHRYLRRAADRLPLAALYQQLASKQIGEAIDVLATDYLHHGAAHVPLDSRQRLERQLFDLDVVLSRPLTSSELGTVSDAMWQTSEISLDLAEWVNAPERKEPHE